MSLFEAEGPAGQVFENVNELLVDEQPASLSQTGDESLETSLEHPGRIAVDVEVVGLGTEQHGDLGVEVEEAAIVLVGFHHQPFPVAGDVVGAKVFGNTTEESRATQAAAVQQMGDH